MENNPHAEEPKQDGAVEPKQPAPVKPPPVNKPSALGGRGVKIGLTLAGIVLAVWLCVPVIVRAMNTVSTDDAYVNGHVTFVAPRVAGQVVKVHVDNNNRVKKGQLLVELDREPYQVEVDIQTAIWETAKAELDVAMAQVNSLVGQSRASRFRLEHAIEEVNNQVAHLRSSVAMLESNIAIRDRSEKDYQRALKLTQTPGAIAQQDVDLKLQDYLVAKSQVRQSLEGVLQIRASLGLPSEPINADDITAAPKSLSEAPADLNQTFSTIREATSEMIQVASNFGFRISSFDLKPNQILAEFANIQGGDIDKTYRYLVERTPTLELARAKVKSADHDWALAKLNLRYCEVRAEIDGVVVRRNVNPGNNVAVGQSLMAVRSLSEIWIDANFKETQLADLRIGQPVRIEVDMYGSRKEFAGRITGLTMGTGQTLALLPPQNATGNFVKIVQRLPVRIDLLDYDPDQAAPLFVGLSVVPYVYFKKPLIGDDPGKGKSLQPFLAHETAP